MKEIKKTYTKPSMKVFELKSKSALLVGSEKRKMYDEEEYDGEFS